MRIRVIGAGIMGRGIAQWAITAGHTVELGDARPESVREAIHFVHDMLDRAERRGRVTARERQAALGRLRPLASPLAADDGGTDLVIEAVLEDLAVKARLLRDLEGVLDPRTMFATNTSSLSVTEIATHLADPPRLAGLHFFNPVPLVRIAEVIAGSATRPDIPPALVRLLEDGGHRAIRVADTPGFLVNHAGRGLVTEALALLEDSVAGPADIDRIAREVLGLRMGPFELMDLTGLDVTSTVMDTVWAGFRYSDRLRPSYLTPTRVTAGLFGRKTGRGWYSYDPDHGGAAAPDAPAASADTPPAASAEESAGTAGRAVCVAGEGPDADDLRRALDEAGISTRPLSQHSNAAGVLVAPWGTTVAEAIATDHLPAHRTLGVDPLCLGTSRLVLAVTPATEPGVLGDLRSLVAALTPAGTPGSVSVVRDTPGSVAQRLLASVVSVAASIAERSIAAPADIDLAVTTALGYPHGPLAWGDRIGAHRMVTLQHGLLTSTGDPRYRPTRWVSERARLGLSLTRPDFDLTHDNAH